jgi:hypothetical protein
MRVQDGRHIVNTILKIQSVIPVRRYVGHFCMHIYVSEWTAACQMLRHQDLRKGRSRRRELMLAVANTYHVKGILTV